MRGRGSPSSAESRATRHLRGSGGGESGGEARDWVGAASPRVCATATATAFSNAALGAGVAVGSVPRPVRSSSDATDFMRFISAVPPEALRACVGDPVDAARLSPCRTRVSATRASAHTHGHQHVEGRETYSTSCGSGWVRGWGARTLAVGGCGGAGLPDFARGGAGEEGRLGAMSTRAYRQPSTADGEPFGLRMQAQVPLKCRRRVLPLLTFNFGPQKNCWFVKERARNPGGRH